MEIYDLLVEVGLFQRWRGLHSRVFKRDLENTFRLLQIYGVDTCSMNLDNNIFWVCDLRPRKFEELVLGRFAVGGYPNIIAESLATKNEFAVNERRYVGIDAIWTNRNRSPDDAAPGSCIATYNVTSH